MVHDTWDYSHCNRTMLTDKRAKASARITCCARNGGPIYQEVICSSYASRPARRQLEREHRASKSSQMKNEKIAARALGSKAHLPHLKALQKGQLVKWMVSIASLAKEKAGVALTASAHASLPGTRAVLLVQGGGMHE